jgi:hypothetical protein
VDSVSVRCRDTSSEKPFFQIHQGFLYVDGEETYDYPKVDEIIKVKRQGN